MFLIWVGLSWALFPAINGAQLDLLNHHLTWDYLFVLLF